MTLFGVSAVFFPISWPLGLSPSWVRSSRSFSLKSWRPGVALNLRGEKPPKKRIQISGYLWPIPSNYWFRDQLKITILKAGRSTQIPVLESEKGNFLYSCCSKLEGWEIEATDPLQWLQNHSWLDFLGVNISRNEVANEFRMSWKDPQNLWSGTLLKKLTCPPMEKERHRDPATFKGAYGFGQVDVKLATLTHRRSPTSSTNPWMNPIHIDSKGWFLWPLDFTICVKGPRVNLPIFVCSFFTSSHVFN